MPSDLDPEAMPAPSHEITQLLHDWVSGDERAFDTLVPLVYDEVRRLAAYHLRLERRGHTLQPTALAHEAFLRLADQQRVSWKSRAHFFAIVAALIRRVLVDHARRHGRAKRGGGARSLSLDDVAEAAAPEPGELLALDDALADLERLDPPQARVVELRFFGGMGDLEIAAVEGISPRTVSRRWRTARAWLLKYLAEPP